MSRRRKKKGLSAQARQSLRERRRTARKKDKLMSPQQRLRALIAAGGNFTVPEGIGLRELLADQYPPDMPYGDLVRAVAKAGTAREGHQYSAWDVLESDPYRYPSEWDKYPPTVEEARVLAQEERLRFGDVLPDASLDYEPSQDYPEDVRARLAALDAAHGKEMDVPLAVGERREELLRFLALDPETLANAP